MPRAAAGDIRQICRTYRLWGIVADGYPARQGQIKDALSSRPFPDRFGEIFSRAVFRRPGRTKVRRNLPDVVAKEGHKGAAEGNNSPQK